MLNASTQSPEAAQTIEHSLSNLNEFLSIAASTAHRIADRIGGSRPEAVPNAKDNAPAPQDVHSRLRALQRIVGYLTEHLNRAENSLG